MTSRAVSTDSRLLAETSISRKPTSRQPMAQTEKRKRAAAGHRKRNRITGSNAFDAANHFGPTMNGHRADSLPEFTRAKKSPLEKMGNGIFVSPVTSDLR